MQANTANKRAKPAPIHNNLFVRGAVSDGAETALPHFSQKRASAASGAPH
jgi:hypothetical protein